LASSGLARLTPQTITSQRELEAQFEAAARDGYAISVEELEDGLNAVAAPVRDYTGGVIAALSVSGPVYRFTEVRMREVIPDIVAAAAAISQRMGHLD
jgi:DNA-binding IclR family transcriptional regulator